MALEVIAVTRLSSGSSCRLLSIQLAGYSILTTVTSRAATVRRWIHTTRHLHRHLDLLVVGFGVQWVPSVSPTPATLQLCVGDRCLIFQLARCNSIPLILRRFLEDQEITFAAIRARYDCQLLQDQWGLTIRNTLEICYLAEERMGRRNASMADIACNCLGEEFFNIVREAKPAEIGRSNWDVSTLSRKQIVYACVDAYVSLQLGLSLRIIDDD